MAAAAFQGAVCFSRSGLAFKCRFPMPCAVATGVPNILVSGAPIAAQGISLVSSHPVTGCGVDTGTLTSASVTVRASGGGVGRLGDRIGVDNTITMGNPTVFIGG